MSLTYYTANKLLDHVNNKAAYSAPANLHVALSTANPGADGSGFAEPSGNGYARVSTAAADWTAGASGMASNVNEIEFAVPTGSWGTIIYFGRYDAASGGNLIDYGTLDASRTIGSGSSAPNFAAGDLQITVS